MRSWNGKIYCNTGDWIQYFTYAVLENGEIRLKKFGSDDQNFDVFTVSPGLIEWPSPRVLVSHPR